MKMTVPDNQIKIFTMKRLILFVCILLISYAFQTKAQDIFYPEIESLLSPNQKLELEKAINILLKARGNENNANDIERKYSKLRKKGKQEAWILKTWEAKQQRIMAEKNYKKAYETISSVYSEIIVNGKYPSAADKTEALELDKSAKSYFEEGDNFLSKLSDDSKETMENTPNEDVESTLHQSHTSKLSGIGQQILAMQKIIGVGSGGKEEITAKSNDDLAWEKAKTANNIDAYYEYLNSNPRGRHMSEANELINNIEKELNNSDVALNDPKNKTNNKNNNGNNNNPRYNEKNKTGNNNFPKGSLIFKVQIAAAVSEISQWMLNAKAPGIKNIETVKSGIWVKYLVGTFGSYNEAANYRDELRSHAPDAFIVVFKNGDQVPVTQEMKN
jgi:hypothetical protein